MSLAADSAPLHWMKITDPDASIPDHPPGVDVRVMLPDHAEFATLQEKLLVDGIPVRTARYLVEQDTISTLAHNGRLAVTSGECHLIRATPRTFPSAFGPAASAARDTYDLLWNTHAPIDSGPVTSKPASEIVPSDWLGFLPHRMLNPAQSEAAPHILHGEENVVVVAPTGTGKTVIGMMAALRAIKEHGRKAAWLVPQRSLTDELNQELDAWRQGGLRVERLSGEYSVDIQRVRDADIWVATTEKFEAICRASSFREALGTVGCLIVDEIHLLGDPTRGSVLEALLARVRDGDARTRIVGLSATVSNAGEIADWLHAELVRTAWRPSRLTWQLPTISAHSDWSQSEAARTRLASSLTGLITSDGGSVLVFCGSKRGVRQTALIIAGSRGANIDGVHPDDLDRLHTACRQARVGLHYKGWDHRQDDERGFRQRDLDVLVATSTVAAGVNLPARAVVVRDTQVGLNNIDVATVQQMFGRAGRVGTGENQGWAFLIVNETERPHWQARLSRGHKVDSQIQSNLPDHILAEAVQQRIHSLREAEQWWVQTLAHHQGSHSLAPLRHAVDFLVEGGYLSATCTPDDDIALAPTELGTVTARIMVSTTVGHELRKALAGEPVPADAEVAEQVLIGALSTIVPKLAQASISEDLKTTVLRLIESNGRLHDDVRPAGTGQGRYAPGDLAKATLLTAANTPSAFHTRARQIGGIPYPTMYPVLEEAPRYLHWLGTQGYLRTLHPWCAIVAADLSRRIRWRRCQPPRGAGRLLWMCEQIATPLHAEDAVPKLWEAATARGITRPDWESTSRPQGCRLEQDDYVALLRERATGAVLRSENGRGRANGPVGSIAITWAGTKRATAILHTGQAVLPALPDRSEEHAEIALFTRRGDYCATGWLAAYSGIKHGSDQ
ncbi:DEAD/DEAH box helicase [Saccharopolyspora sp. ASAGF58]|uniref:DEAD/DEAH box helicase n=1 Tax=Saccharopolyspora sp. ASAGF58 TaxID=2719023 RepID=UPI00144000E7|nr:DEAD/DEAH box helicase [Saccharopolyspora sp. ASAGF58]QIZ39148.1 DEAD/DEAH box helicase [Saccharopolyspora sp. ASAGF58]